MTVSIELKLAAKPGALAKMYVGFSKVDVVPNIVSKEAADDEGNQRLVVEFEDDVTSIDIVLEQLSHINVIQVVGVKGAQPPQEKAVEKVEIDEKEVFKVSTEHREQAAPISSEKIDIFDNHRGRRDKF